MIDLFLNPFNEPFSLLPAMIFALVALVLLVTSRFSALWILCAVVCVPFAVTSFSLPYVWAAGPWFVGAGLFLAIGAKRFEQAMVATGIGIGAALISHVLLGRIDLIQMYSPMPPKAVIAINSTLAVMVMAAPWVLARWRLGWIERIAGLCVYGGVLGVLEMGRVDAATCFADLEAFCLSSNPNYSVPVEVFIMFAVILLVGHRGFKSKAD